jgi:hypothetical protein
MAYTQTFLSSAAITSAPINSTKVTVFSNVACYVNINGAATTSSPIGVVPNRKNDVNMQGLGNTLSLLPVGSVTAAMTITQVGNVITAGTVTGSKYIQS